MPSADRPRSKARTVPNEVRIVGGLWKRTRLPVADKPGLRPTPDRVRETLFNWLGQDLAGWRCVDAFAGTGALGLEAASRGAAQVLLVEQDPELVDGLRKLKARLEAAMVEVRRANGLTVLKDLAGSGQDLVFLDPPFDADLFDKALAAAVSALAAEGLVYLEAPRAWTQADAQRHGLHLLRHLKAGAVHAHLMGRVAPAP
jgi:16S rRNA (guanine(966)-N(2))-methyltransferase RsmD